MKKQTALQWLIEQVHSDEYTHAFGRTYISIDLIEQAKEMEKEQIMKTARQCHFEGVRQSAKTSEQYIAYSQNYYFCNYGK